MGAILDGSFKEVVSFRELEYLYNDNAWVVVWNPNKTISIGEWSICGGGQLERFYCGIICHWPSTVYELHTEM